MKTLFPELLLKILLFIHQRMSLKPLIVILRIQIRVLLFKGKDQAKLDSLILRIRKETMKSVICKAKLLSFTKCSSKRVYRRWVSLFLHKSASKKFRKVLLPPKLNTKKSISKLFNHKGPPLIICYNHHNLRVL